MEPRGWCIPWIPVIYLFKFSLIFNYLHKTSHAGPNVNHDYEVVTPFQVDDRGRFMTYAHGHTDRKRRSLDEAKQFRIYYNLTAYGIDFHFNLTLNEKLFAQSYIIEYWNSAGMESRSHVHPASCYYHGHISENKVSRVVLSNCNGLHGIFSTSNEQYYVEPVLGKNSSLVGQEHIVYKHSSLKYKYSDSHCGVRDTLKDTLSKLVKNYRHPPHKHIERNTHSRTFLKKKIFNSMLNTEKNRNQNLKQMRSKNNINCTRHLVHDIKHNMEPRYMGDESYSGIKNKRRHKIFKRNHGRRTRSISKERHVETLVVVDRMMIGYHGKSDIEAYVLTIMNIVAKLFHEASIGNSINVIVTRLVLLTEDQRDLEISHHADKSLDSFCKWQKKYNSGNGAGMTHHDNAILLTRYDICTYKNQPCGTLGLAPVAGMCELDRSCSIVEDIGLSSAFTIAHELGHNFGMHHDGSGNACGTRGHAPARIMAARLTGNSNPFTWSQCSRHYITGFLDSGQGDCLENSPPSKVLKYPRRLPGEKHNADAQCRLQHGSHSRHCKPERLCKELWCLNPLDRCTTNHIPAAEGTSCVSGRKTGWCYMGRCARGDYKPVSVDGEWGPWSVWGTCSRSCGGGVKSSDRQCDNPRPIHGGRYCLGERKRYLVCKTQDCPLNAKDFRRVQCSKFNRVPFRKKYYKWIPFTGGQVNPCSLNCVAKGYNFYTERAHKVHDGTRCYPDSLDMCIDGQCRYVGCDYVLGSAAVEDKCRVCGGDGKSCDTVKGMYHEEHPRGEYYEVAEIPKGSVHVKIWEAKISKNYLALKSAESDRYYINGAWTIDWPRKFSVAGTVFRYERPNGKPESLRSVGPTAETVMVMVLLQEKNEGIKYEYNVEMTNMTNITEYRWLYEPWSSCSESCGKGVSNSVSVCVRKKDKREMSTQHCPPQVRPHDLTRTCNLKPCKPTWVLGNWTRCTVTCGGGLKARTVQCVRTIEEAGKIIQRVLEDKECKQKKPLNSRACGRTECPSRWETDGWTKCNSKCGIGIMTRNVYCVGKDKKQYSRKGKCLQANKPLDKLQCNMGPCPQPSWFSGKWSKCSVACGIGYQTRTVECRTHTGQTSNVCPLAKPNHTRSCKSSDRCYAAANEPDCHDENKVAYCPQVLRYKFCNRAYFRQKCCKTCAAATRKGR